MADPANLNVTSTPTNDYNQGSRSKAISPSNFPNPNSLIYAPAAINRNEHTIKNVTNDVRKIRDDNFNKYKKGDFYLTKGMKIGIGVALFLCVAAIVIAAIDPLKVFDNKPNNKFPGPQA